MQRNECRQAIIEQIEGIDDEHALQKVLIFILRMIAAYR